ncbi:MAG TPA: hypothetical protein VIH57_09170 [Bacteroidales bacterium]
MESTDKEMFLGKMFNDIRNEGLTTYVAYKAGEFMPSMPKSQDYLLLELVL